MRVAGTVIWATDLREDRHSSGSAKAGTKTTSYSYSASFAVALSARPIRSVGRIWADGKLLRGQAGDWKGETGFRLYLGTEDQAVDPLIAAAEGIGSAPAHRGIAYAMFEGMQLADFGNRIPSLTFEVEADAGDVAVTAIAGELADGALAGSGGVALGGFAASGDSVRGALEALAQACPMPLSDDGAVLRIADATSTEIGADALGSGAGEARQPSRERGRAEAGGLPDAVALGYYEPARDYQTGLQRARRDGIGRREQRIELPAAIPADTGRMLAEARLARAWTERDRATVRVPWRLLDTRCGTLATIAGEARQLSPTLWRLAGLARGRRGTERAAAGHVAGERFLLVDATTLLPLDVPLASLQTTAQISAIGPNDGGSAAVVAVTVLGRAVRPPSPVRLRATRAADGTIAISWTRRSRLGWSWLDGADVPLAEDREHYLLTLIPSVGAARVAEPEMPGFTYSVGMQAADGATGAPSLTATLAQLGTSAASEPIAATWIW